MQNLYTSATRQPNIRIKLGEYLVIGIKVTYILTESKIRILALR